MKEILAYIINSRCTPVSWHSISKETSIASPNTVESYVENMKDLFILLILNLIEPDSKIAYRKNKKVHITDPFLYNSIAEYVRARPFESSILESVVAAHLARKYETFYWRNKTEVDIVIRLDKIQVGVEVKTWAGSWRKPKHIKSIILLNKETIPTFLASLDI
jgi:Predicted ATPase (AAA+ superfamily)